MTAPAGPSPDENAPAEDGGGERSANPESSNQPEFADPFRSPRDIDDATDQVAADSKDHSVFAEPWMKTDKQCFVPNDPPTVDIPNAVVDPENSVWDEPGLSRQLSGETPQDAVTWFRWYEGLAATTSSQTSWLVTLAVAASSGILAVLAAMFLGPQKSLPIVMVVIGAPFFEEILKIAPTMYICERQPWLFKSRTQIILCCVASGLTFAFLENLLYLNVYIPSPTAAITQWRWIACTTLHVTCSTLAGIGCAMVWRNFQSEKRMPRVADAARMITTAIALHAAFNTLAILMDSRF